MLVLKLQAMATKLAVTRLDIKQATNLDIRPGGITQQQAQSEWFRVRWLNRLPPPQLPLARVLTLPDRMVPQEHMEQAVMLSIHQAATHKETIHRELVTPLKVIHKEDLIDLVLSKIFKYRHFNISQ